MIALHRLAHPDEELHINPDLLLTVEATPDTVLTLTTGARLVVGESPAEVVEAVRHWHASVAAAAQGLRGAVRPLAG
jgi:flagellar protein FlbD